MTEFEVTRRSENGTEAVFESLSRTVQRAGYAAVLSKTAAFVALPRKGLRRKQAENNADNKHCRRVGHTGVVVNNLCCESRWSSADEITDPSFPILSAASSEDCDCETSSSHYSDLIHRTRESRICPTQWLIEKRSRKHSKAMCVARERERERKSSLQPAEGNHSFIRATTFESSRVFTGNARFSSRRSSDER